jgi:hypothetical protein
MAKKNYKMEGIRTARNLNKNIAEMTETEYEATPGLKAAGKINKNIAKMSKVKKVGIKVNKY